MLRCATFVLLMMPLLALQARAGSCPEFPDHLRYDTGASVEVLGYGGGFYDRTLEALRARRPTIAVGFAFAAQEMGEVPTEPTDQPLDAVVTEAGIRFFS